MPSFSVTFERYLPHDAEDDICEPDERGYVAEGLSLREAMEELFDMPCGHIESVEADSWPVSVTMPPRWITANGTADYRTGIAESRSIHFPRNITAASAMRCYRVIMKG